MANWYYPQGSTAKDGWTTNISNQTPGWQHTGLRIGELADGRTLSLKQGDVERVILPLHGSFHVIVASANETQEYDLAGRESIWHGPTDLVYAGPGCTVQITGNGRIAVPSAHATTRRGSYYLPAEATQVGIRGSGNMSREVRNFGTPDVLDAESIIACEVLTPGGNWSSYPAHKHDKELKGVETELEEIYYVEMRTNPGIPPQYAKPDAITAVPTPDHSDPYGYIRVSASDDRSIDVLAEVRDGDTVLVPFGWHGPAIPAPGSDMYYLNVMAGPGREHAWLITDHPDQTWVRSMWDAQEPDPRLPYRG